jgi:hypothetical protein
MPLFNVYAIPIMDGAFASVCRIINENPTLARHPAVLNARVTAEEARKNVHRAAEALKATSGFWAKMVARRELRQAGYAFRLAYDALIATADKYEAE